MYKKAFLFWMPLAIVTTVLSGMIYAGVQQDLRMSANDPQVQLAQDFRDALNSGNQPQQLISSQNQTDMVQSLSPYVIIYDQNGKSIVSSALLNGSVPTPPKSVFSYVDKKGQDRFTWQPEKDAREAVVIMSYNSNGQKGYVLAGRSLYEVEQRETNIGIIILAGWFAAVLLGYLGVLLKLRLAQPKREMPAAGESEKPEHEAHNHEHDGHEHHHEDHEHHHNHES